MVASSLSADLAAHVNGYGLRLLTSTVGGDEAILIDIGKDHHSLVDGGHAIQWVAIRILMPLQARDCVLRGGGGKPPLPVWQF